MIFLLIRASSYNIFIVWEILKAAVLPSLNSKWEIQEISKPLPNLNIGLSQAQTLNCFVIISICLSSEDRIIPLFFVIGFDFQPLSDFLYSI